MSKGIQSISIGFRILKAIVDSEAPLTLSAVASLAGLSASKTRMYLVSLIEAGAVMQHGETGRYMLGPYATHLGIRAIQRIDDIEIARQAIQTLHQKTGAHVLLSNWSEKGLAIVARKEGTGSLPFHFRIGGAVSLTTTATGLVCLAFAPVNEANRVMQAEFRSLGLTKTEQARRIKRFESDIAAIRRDGFAYAPQVKIVSEVVLSGFGAVAAPIFGERRRLRFVITALYLSENSKLGRDAMGAMVREVAERASVMAAADLS